jgi:hypothetical protein
VGLLKQKQEIEAKINFYIKEDSIKSLIAWIDEYDGNLCFDSKPKTMEQCKAICEWYLNVYGEL